MASNPTVSELRKAAEISDQEIVAVVLADLATEGYPLTEVAVLDFTAAVKASTFATLVLRDVHATHRHKQDAVRTAILLAHPVKG